LRILITGANGAVGSNLAKAILDDGDEVVSIRHDDRPVDPAKLLGIDNKITWCKGDITDETLVKRIMADYEIELVYHLAALPIVRAGVKTILPIYEVNLIGTLRVLEALKEQTLSGGEPGLVYISTDKVYGETEWGRPYKETDPLNALAPYESSKMAADVACRMFYKMGFIKKLAVVRPSNMYGPGDMNSRIIPNTIRRCLAGQNPILYAIKDSLTGFGTPLPYVREFTHFQDFVAIARKIGNDVEKAKGEAFNVGSGITKNQMNVIDEILKGFPSLKADWQPAPAYSRIEIPYQTLDHSKTIERFNWTPRVGFEEGIEDTIEWWKSHPNLLSVIPNARNLGA